MRKIAFAAALLVAAALVVAQEVGVTITYLFDLAPKTDASRVIYDFALARQLRSTAVMYAVNLFTGLYMSTVTDYPLPVSATLHWIGSVTASTGSISVVYIIPVIADDGNGGEQPPGGSSGGSGTSGSGSGDSGGSSGWNPGIGSWNGSWDPVPWWAKEWTSKNVRDYIRYPFRILVEMVGLQLLSAVVYGVIMFATFMHTKSAFATGVVSMIMATAMIMVLPELVWISYVALAFGIAAVVYEVAKKVV